MLCPFPINNVHLGTFILPKLFPGFDKKTTQRVERERTLNQQENRGVHFFCMVEKVSVCELLGGPLTSGISCLLLRMKCDFGMKDSAKSSDSLNVFL